MTIKSIQKVIKVGSSLAVTIPAKDAKFYGLQPGDTLEFSWKRPEGESAKNHAEEVVALTQQLIKRHQNALDNLRDR